MIDVFVALGYLTGKDVEAWRMKRIPYLENVLTSIWVKLAISLKRYKEIV